MSQYVAISQDGEVDIHIPDAIGGYTTLCGMDAYDQEIEQVIVPVPRGKKITCRDCYAIWEMTHRYSRLEFDVKK